MTFHLNQTAIPGCLELIPKVLRDERGLFVKTFHEGVFQEGGLNTHWAEEYYSVSKRGVLRGMHFQVPPHDHVKLVYCPQGRVFDVVLDLRLGSPAFGRFSVFELDEGKANMIYIPSGCAHGFYSFSNTATMVYKVSNVYAPEYDAGLHWNSIGVEWPDKCPVVSERDMSFGGFPDFVTPFVFSEEKRCL